MVKGYSHKLKGEDAQINVARYIKEKSKHFEVVIDPELAGQYVLGKVSDIRDVLRNEGIWLDAKKGIRPTEHELINSFGTSDAMKIAETILKKGIIQVAESFRDEKREMKKRQIVELIRKNCIDAQTSKPIPATRIETALAEAKIKIDENKTAEDQLQAVISALRKMLPLKMETKNIDITVPAKYAHGAYGRIKQIVMIKSESWNPDGSYRCSAEMPAGMQEEFYDLINALTHGEVQVTERK